MPKTTKRADALNLDDLRYDVRVEGTIGTTSSTNRTRYVGTLILIEGPAWIRNADVVTGHQNAFDSYVTVHLAAGPRDTLRVIVRAEADVTVDRASSKSIHFGGAS